MREHKSFFSRIKNFFFAATNTKKSTTEKRNKIEQFNSNIRTYMHRERYFVHTENEKEEMKICNHDKVISIPPELSTAFPLAAEVGTVAGFC